MHINLLKSVDRFPPITRKYQPNQDNKGSRSVIQSIFIEQCVQFCIYTVTDP